MDKIAFRLVERTYGPDLTRSAVEVRINGRTLPELIHGRAPEVAAVDLDATSALWPGHLIWLEDPPDDADLVEDGRVAVVTCGCGVFGCGGAAARIRTVNGSVVWDEFTAANYGPSIDLGPFRFHEAKYRDALNAVADEYRLSGGP